MHLLLIRHGETDWNNQGRMQGITNTPLNARGREQAGRLAARLAGLPPVDVLYTSPLTRARETAEIVGHAIGREPIPDIRLVERAAGKLEGLTLAEIERDLPEIFQVWHKDRERWLLAGAEDQEALYHRVAGFLAYVRERHTGRVAVVTHGGTLSMFLAHVMALDIWLRFPFRFDNTSLSQVDYDSEPPRVELLNDTAHLHEETFELTAPHEKLAIASLEGCR